MIAIKAIVTRLWERLLSGFSKESPRFKAVCLEWADPTPMERQGVLIPDTPELYSYCRRCDNDIKVKIRRDENGKKGYYRICCGRTKRVSSKDFRVWKICVEPIIELFREAIGIKGVVEAVVPGRIWKIGRRRQVPFMYINHVMEDDLKPFFPILARFPNAVLVTPLEFAQKRLSILLPNRGIAWENVSRLDEDYTVHFDMEKIEMLIGPEEKPKSKSPMRRGSRTVNIEKLVAELKEHYRASKDNYYTVGKLLPRPTQAELARRVGIRQDDVSRCLNDPDATLLQMLWKNAEDVRAVLNS